MPEEMRRGYKIEIRELPVDPLTQAFGAPGNEEFVAGNEINRSTIVKKQELLIDGKPKSYYKTEEGYSINYMPPSPSLAEAARNYIDTRREK